jgi:hypothetical protein
MYLLRNVLYFLVWEVWTKLAYRLTPTYRFMTCDHTLAQTVESDKKPKGAQRSFEDLICR